MSKARHDIRPDGAARLGYYGMGGSVMRVPEDLTQLVRDRMRRQRQQRLYGIGLGLLIGAIFLLYFIWLLHG